MDYRLSAYQQALAYLFERTTGGSRFGLERTAALLSALGNPHERLTCFHVAGTNGKGSVCATLEGILRERGFRVGKYTSPHLVDFRERFLIDGRPVDEQYVVDFIQRWLPDVERSEATFFEATTAMAFDWFARSAVDVAIIETGLGGRLDSTNVVMPVAAGVASIGIDHVEYLGNTREEIAAEKAGIFKRGVPAVIGEPDAPIAHLLSRLATDHGARPVLSVWTDAAPSDIAVSESGTTFAVTINGEHGQLHTPLAGMPQASNTVLALLMLRSAGSRWSVSLAEASRYLSSVRLPGRFHREGRFIFDVAHNPDGAAVLASTVRSVGEPRPVAALLTVLADKDWRGVMHALAPVVDVFVLTNAPTAPASRAWRVEEAHEFARSHGWGAVLEPDFDRAIDAASRVGATVLATGSFHTVGDAMTRLQVDPLAG